MQREAERYRRVAATFTQWLREVPSDGWDRPAPCDGWVTRDVVRHLTEWVPGFFHGAGGPPLPAGPSADDDPLGAWLALDTALQGHLDDPATARSTIEHPQVGPSSFAEAVDRFVLGDVLVHTWDVARACGLDERIDPEVVHEQLEGLQAMDEVLRQSGHYGPKVEVPADADEQTRLIAFTGRQP